MLDLLQTSNPVSTKTTVAKSSLFFLSSTRVVLCTTLDILRKNLSFPYGSFLDCRQSRRKWACKVKAFVIVVCKKNSLFFESRLSSHLKSSRTLWATCGHSEVSLTLHRHNRTLRVSSVHNPDHPAQLWVTPNAPACTFLPLFTLPIWHILHNSSRQS